MLNAEIIQGDALQELQKLKSGSVHCCVTSPPYWGLRDYQVSGQLGLEKTPEEYVAKMVEVFRGVRRVLRDDGTLFLNLGDSYWGGGNYRGINSENTLSEKQNSNRGARGICQELGSLGKTTSWGLKPKDLVGIPWRVAFALQADGWWLRQDIIWYKRNPMPESIKDRCTKAHEFIFLLSKSARYYFDNDAIREPYSENSISRYESPMMGTAPTGRQPNGDADRRIREKGIRDPNPIGRNKRDVWDVTSEPFKDAHFATFPPDLIKPCILAGTSAKGCCPKCGAPWERVVEKTPATMNIRVRDNAKGIIDKKSGVHGRYKASEEEVENYGPEKMGESKTIGWQPTCDCGEEKTVPCTVLDPFAGSGTTGMVALELGRKAILIELNPKYVDLIRSRTNVTPGLALA